MTETYRTPWAVLGVDPDASRDEVHRAYRRLVREWHPDRFADDPRLRRLAEERLKEVNAAYRAVAGTNESPPRTFAAARRQTGSRLVPCPPDEDCGTCFPTSRVNFLAPWPNRLFLIFCLASLVVAVLLHGVSRAGVAYLLQMTILPAMFAVASRLKLGTARILRVAYPLVTLLFLGLLLAEKVLHHLDLPRLPAQPAMTGADGMPSVRFGLVFGPVSPVMPESSGGRRVPGGPSAPFPPSQPVEPMPPLAPLAPTARSAH
jgi:hypothetical protein